VCVDVGASDGRLTTCLLQRAPRGPFAVDRRTAQLDASSQDPRVVVMEQTNARTLDPGYSATSRRSRR